MNTVFRKYSLILGKLLVLGLVTAGLSLGQSTRHRHRTITPCHPRSTISRAKRAKEYLRFVGNLRAQGTTVQITGEKVRQPFFSPPGRIINVNNEGLQVFEYANASKANEEAQRISPDGMTIGTTKPSWMATPHFFKREKLIVLYVGSNESILRQLIAVLGAQFAGS